MIYLLALLLTILIFLKSKLNLIFIILFSFLINSIAIIIYKFGFGFDFFIHEATMELINATGAVEPKPLYYLGQYSIIILLHKLLLIPIHYAHLLLVPVLASFLIPFNLYLVLKKKFSSQTNTYLSLLVFITLPLALFFNTTPQNLAYLFLILVIIRGLNCRDYFDIFYIFALSLATLLIQPIAGIPAILLSLAITIYYSDFKKIKKHLYRFIFILSAISLPGAFVLVNKLNGIGNADESVSSASPVLRRFLEGLTLQLPKEENIILNFIYFFAFNIKLLLLGLFIIGAYTVYKNKKEFKVYRVYLLIAFGVFISFLITNNLSFSYLISYERLAFSARIFNVSLLLLTPFFMVGVFSLINSLSQKRTVIKIIFIGFYVFLIPIFVYINYPRLDNYHNSHGYSVSQDDIDAVNYIEDNSKDDYIVLANQQTSVAALREFGFTRYYKTDEGEDIFYYPIPTGAPLYEYFLKMVDEEPSRDTMLEAMDIANVDTGYFVINKYWWAFPKIVAEAKIEANSWKSINNGEIFIFKFNKK